MTMPALPQLVGGGGSPERCVAARRSPALHVLGLDYLRGLAVLLMLADHVVAVAEVPALEVVRLITRAALPGFALVVGSLSSRKLSPRRQIEWGGAAVVVTATMLALGLGLGGLLLVWLALGRYVARVWSPAAQAGALILALVVGANGFPWPVPGDYSPPFVVGLVLVGAYLGPSVLGQAGDRLPSWLGWFGRHALELYVGHLVFLLLIGVLL